jgi:hypothetical protein
MSPQTSAPPVVLSVEPSFALPGGEIVLNGRALLASLTEPTQVLFGESPGTIVFASATRLTVLVPDAASGGESITITTPHGTTSVAFTIGTLLSENLHPVANPAVDAGSNIYVTFSGGRGQSVPTSLFRIDDESTLHAIAAEIMNPTGLALDAIGGISTSPRATTAPSIASTPMAIFPPTPRAWAWLPDSPLTRSAISTWATAAAPSSRLRPTARSLSLPPSKPSVSAYHLAFSPNGNLYVTGPTTSSNDCVYEIDPHGVVSPWFSNLGRPQGIAFDLQGNLYVAASWRGHRGIIRITPERQASFIIAGTNLVGLAFDPESRAHSRHHFGSLLPAMEHPRLHGELQNCPQPEL